MSGSKLLILFLVVWCMTTVVWAQSSTPKTSFPNDSLPLSSTAAHAKELSKAGFYDQAVDWGTRALKEAALLHGTHSEEYTHALIDLAGYYSRSGDFDNAIKLGNQALQLNEELSGTETAVYAQSLNNLARYHSYVGNYIEAVRLGRKAMELRAKIFGKESAEYATSVSNMAGYYSRLGNFDEALLLGEEARGIRERVLGKENTDYAQSLNNLSKYYYYSGHYDEAIRLGNEALAIRRHLLGAHHPDYATALSNMADYEMRVGHLDDAMRLGTEAMEIRRSVLGEHHPDFAESVSNLASYHYALGHTDKAVEYGRLAMNLRHDLLGEHHLSYAHSVCKMAIYFSAAEQPDSADAYAVKATSQYATNVMSTFADLTAMERDQFWNRVKPWFTNTILRLASKHPTPKMVSSALDGTLLAKSLLLNSELEITKLLLESSDSVLINTYRQLQANKALLFREYERTISQRRVNTDSLQRVITHQERRLVKRSKVYGDCTKALTINWKDVKKRLKADEIAIEFACFQDADGKEFYGAFVLSCAMSNPVWVPLADSHQITSIDPKKLYTTCQLSQLIWQPLSDYLCHAKTVYFSPAGELYNIGIESLPFWEGTGETVSDRWLFYRLSSTRELALDHRQSTISSVVVYGGITYDTGGTQLKKKRAAKYLPGTRKEAEDIARDFTAEGIPTQLLLGNTATEGSFKQLSSHSPSVIHIATHGFYWTDSEVKKGALSEKLGFLSMYDEMDANDQALTRSGLLFAGANDALTGEDTDNEDDGVLTAKEISVLDLRGTDLLVLSACQTGLGKITGDGVFGLQRGFKKAGARSLLMTLWKVDDVATRLLMSRFYSYLHQGINKHEALRLAQHDLRMMTPSDEGKRNHRHAISSRQKRAKRAGARKIYDNPHYWAAFILLDGLE